MNEIEETYESIDCQNEHRIRQADYSQTKNSFYTLPIRSRQAPVNEYEHPLTNRTQARSQTDTSWTDSNDSVTYLANHQGVKNKKCTKKCLIVISVFLALLFVLTSAAFCFSILMDEIIPKQSESAQHSASSGSEESVNQTQLLDEINMLKLKLNQLMSEAMNTQDYIRSAASQLNTVQSNLSLLSNKISTVQTDTRRVNNTQIVMNSQINSLQSQITTTNRNVATVTTRVNNWITSPYQNCHQETSSCTLNTLINDDKRLYCTTGSLSVNITVSKKKTVKRECINYDKRVYCTTDSLSISRNVSKIIISLLQ